MNNNLITKQSLIKHVLDLYEQNKNKTFDYNDNQINLDYKSYVFKLLDHDNTHDLKYLKAPFCNIFYNNNFNFYRMGIKKTMKNEKNKDVNCSLYSSILTCIIDNYIECNMDERINFINNFIIQILEDINKEKLYTKFNYRTLGWKKKNLINSIRNFENNNIVVQFLSDYLNINIFIIDIQLSKFFISYGEKEFNKYKKNYFLTYYNDVYEPVFCNNETNIRHDNIPFSIIINHHKNILDILNVNFSKKNKDKVFTIGNENLEQYMINPVQNSNYDVNSKIVDNVINDSETINKNNDFDEFSDTDLYTQQNVELLNDSAVDTEIEINNTNNKDIFYKKYNDVIKLNNITFSKKISYLQEIAIKLNIPIKTNIVYKNGNKKMKTKAQLIDDIKEIL
jgi:hypothetical protein